MQSKLLLNDGERVFMLIVDPGEEAFETIRDFAIIQDITAASVKAIGAFETAVLAFFDLTSKSYVNITVDAQSEVLSLIGDITLDEKGKPNPHLHAVLGLANGHTRGGHFVKGYVKPTLEVIIRETPQELRRRYCPEFGIALIDPST
ncbi:MULTISPECIES: PPC domain-containing DNA-binding protein [Brucella/Ochrobactrum group]|uniref:DNA-binding protein n=3 Tax=Brucella/Ochrobactrum group TaxID=2826938 RepID=A0A502BJB6_9HYPH|nr:MULTISPECIES: PPC domain-containing DNA-binding protein [Brucella/Ochrobactrum group]KAB0565817.1 DNA-binding protein [Brucella pituitosa]MCX2699412.1 DNA-binding protein [Ochrobactrum chromiisoli]TPF73957.1 DNA-binding protein [Brucella gallinifaecis]